MTRILDVRFLLSLVMTTVFFGCTGGSSGRPARSPENKYQTFVALKQQIIAENVPLNDAGQLQTDYQSGIQSAGCRGDVVARLSRAQPLLDRYVRIGTELSQTNLVATDPGTFSLDLDNGIRAKDIVETELCRCGKCVGGVAQRGDDGPGVPRQPDPPRTPNRPNPPIEPPPPRAPLNIPPPLLDHQPKDMEEARNACTNWAIQHQRQGCGVQPGRLVAGPDGNTVFVSDPKGDLICHCGSGRFESHN